MIAADERDEELVHKRMQRLNAIAGPRVGDYVVFTDDVTRRISHVWEGHAQTSDQGSYYLGDGYVSMSGSLHPGVPVHALTLTSERKPGLCWVFHRNWPLKDAGVYAMPEWRVYHAACEAPR